MNQANVLLLSDVLIPSMISAENFLISELVVILLCSMQARPLFKDRRKFPKMADPLLQGRYPMRGLYQALAVAAMCLQEQAATRPLIGDVVTALSYLASQAYDPNAPAMQSSRVGPSTPRSREERKNHGGGGGSDSKSATDSPHRDSPKLRLRDSIKGMNLGVDFGRTDGDGSGGSGRKWGLEEFERQDSRRDSPNHLVRPRDSPKAVNRDADRERAIAEAKVWGENWRERKRANAPKSFDCTNE